MNTRTGLKHVAALIAAFTAFAGMSLPSQAGSLVDRPGLQRPPLAGKPSASLVLALNAIIAAEIAAQQQQDAAVKKNPFLKPRPRPDREYLANVKPEKPLRQHG